MTSETAATSESKDETKIRWGMVFDMDRCVGCQTCTIACKQSNETTAGVLWRNVLDYEVGEFPEVDRTFLLTGCQHCDVPPCVPVCPTGATWKRDDGLVIIDYDICIGCGSCVVGCPYQARTIVKEQLAYYHAAPTVLENRLVQRQREGVAQKCTFCVGRIDDGLARGLKPGVDPAATPACAASCISKAISFGDFADPQSNVSRLVAENEAYRMHEHLGTNPFIHYIGERQSNQIEPGPVQTAWDWRAAMNFILGGMSAGLFVMAYAAYLVGAIGVTALLWLNVLAGAVMGCGLVCVFLKLGRRFRFWRVATRWQSSWMTRETYFVGLIYGSLLADLLRPQPLTHALVAAGATGFLLCQANILHAAKGIPIWRERIIVPMFVATGVLEGAALLAFAAAVAGFLPGVALLAGSAMVMLAVAMAAMWSRYVPLTRSTSRGEIATVWRPVLLAGQLIPSGTVLLAGMAPDEGTRALLIGAAAVAIVLGGAFWKYIVIVRAAHFQGHQIPGRGAAVAAGVSAHSIA